MMKNFISTIIGWAIAIVLLLPLLPVFIVGVLGILITAPLMFVICIPMSKKGELEACRQEFAKQIRQGVLLLPVGFRLVEVVKTDSIIDVEIIKDQAKAAEQVYIDDHDEEDLGGICDNCQHWVERTPLGRTCGKDLHGNDCGWCETRSRTTSPIAGCKEYFKNKNEEES